MESAYCSGRWSRANCWKMCLNTGWKASSLSCRNNFKLKGKVKIQNSEKEWKQTTEKVHTTEKKRKLASPDISSTRHGKCQKDPETRREKVKEVKANTQEKQSMFKKLMMVLDHEKSRKPKGPIAGPRGHKQEVEALRALTIYILTCTHSICWNQPMTKRSIENQVGQC